MADYNLGPYRPRPMGEYNDAERYLYLDIVSFRGSTYINCNVDMIDGISSIGIPPEGSDESAYYWMKIAEKGDKGDMADTYSPYKECTNGTWDFSECDKIYIPDNGVESLVINNVYNGCCGMIVTRKDLVLPNNSLKSLDYKYVSPRNSNEYYFYTFTYAQMGVNTFFYIWHRTVITNA